MSPSSSNPPSSNPRRILCLRLPRLPIDRSRLPSQGSVAAPDDGASPFVVVAKADNALKLHAVDAAASALGLAPGMPLADARAMVPALRVAEADEAADARALDDVADWCDRFTPLVALDPPDGLFLDITGCAHLFGGEARLIDMVAGALARRGFAVGAAIAGTAMAARALARQPTRHGRGRIAPPGEEAAILAPLPIEALGASEAITRGLRRAGLKTIADVALRERKEIAARFGASFVALLERALGLADAPISPRKPPPDYVVERRFAEPVATETVVAATLAGLARALADVMARSAKGARRLEAAFFRADGVTRMLTVETARPVTNADVVARLFRERLAALADPLDPGFGFDLIRLSAARVETMAEAQHDFDGGLRDNDEVAALVDRIGARLGPARVLVHLPRDTHIPERAAFAAPAHRALTAAMRETWPARPEGEPPRRPLRLFERPEPVEVIAEVPDGPPVRFRWRRATHAVAHAEGPERIAMEWWRAGPDARTRDYFRVEDEQGLRFWLYRDGLYGREGGPLTWFMHGLFA